MSEDPMAKLATKLQEAHEAADASHEVVVGAVRGLLECASMGDREAVDILHKIRGTPGCRDEALLDALTLFFDAQEKHRVVSAEVRAYISKQEG
jgi:hypothetical protein